MTYDVELAERIRASVHAESGLTEKAMFGGLAFLVNGNMAVTANSQGSMMVRVDPAQSQSLLDEPRVRRFEMRGRQMDGWLLVTAEAVTDDGALRRWVSTGLAYARALPHK